jgi:predicted nucleic acid-binding protein
MRAFIDTNVLIYWVDAGPRADVVEQLLGAQAVLSVQVLNEFANVLRKKRHMAVADIRSLCTTLVDVCEIYELSVRTHQLALHLMERYLLSFYDANIVAAAALSGCPVLWSEDMQTGLNVSWADNTDQGVLSIRNPFAA